MMNPIYLTDTNVFIYPYKAGGIDAVNSYLNTHEVTSTDQVMRELLGAPDAAEAADFASILSPGSNSPITVLDTDVGAAVRTGSDTGKNPGERSMRVCPEGSCGVA